VIDAQFTQVAGASAPAYSTKILGKNEILTVAFDEFFQLIKLLPIKVFPTAATRDYGPFDGAVITVGDELFELGQLVV